MRTSDDYVIRTAGGRHSIVRGMAIPDLPGLAIIAHTGVDDEGEPIGYDGTWTITHLASGLKIGGFLPDPETAFVVAHKFLAVGGDWTADGATIRTDPLCRAAALALIDWSVDAGFGS